MRVPERSVVWERALGGTASVPSHARMPRMPITFSTASCTFATPRIMGINCNCVDLLSASSDVKLLRQVCTGLGLEVA